MIMSVFNQSAVTVHDAICLFLNYVAYNKKLSFIKLELFYQKNYDEDILKIAKCRLINPNKVIEVNIDEL